MLLHLYSHCKGILPKMTFTLFIYKWNQKCLIIPEQCWYFTFLHFCGMFYFVLKIKMLIWTLLLFTSCYSYKCSLIQAAKICLILHPARMNNAHMLVYFTKMCSQIPKRSSTSRQICELYQKKKKKKSQIIEERTVARPDLPPASRKTFHLRRHEKKRWCSFQFLDWSVVFGFQALRRIFCLPFGFMWTSLSGSFCHSGRQRPAKPQREVNLWWNSWLLPNAPSAPVLL